MKNYLLLLTLSLCLCAAPIDGSYAQERPAVDWSRFDFVPGDEIIFEDNLEGERIGEFPRKWDLVDGLIEVASMDGENVIMFRRNNTNSTGGIVPLMKNSSEAYLPDEFTIEFDAYFDQHNRIYRLLLYDGKNQQQINRSVNPRSSNRNDRIRIYQNSVVYGSSDRGFYPGFSGGSGDAQMSVPGWRRVSISFNKGALKVYLDDARVLNMPRIDYNPIGATIAYHNPSGRDHAGYIKNIRIAKGAVPLYERILTDGKIVTTGIRFDVNQATLRPESLGTLREIVNLMMENDALNFSVEGHTDSDGNESHNQSLSEARAKAVMDEMIKMGISAARLKWVGHGQARPVANNSTPEGKALNRRVEFVAY